MQISNFLCTSSWKIKDMIAIRKCTEWTASRWWENKFLSRIVRYYPDIWLCAGKNYECSRTVWPVFRPCSKVRSPLLNAPSQVHNPNQSLSAPWKIFTSSCRLKDATTFFRQCGVWRSRNRCGYESRQRRCRSWLFLLMLRDTAWKKISFFVVMFSFSLRLADSPLV